MLHKYTESCPIWICVASQIRGTLSWNPKQIMAFGLHNTTLLWCNISYLMLLSRNLFLCLHLETNSVRLFNNFFGSDLAIIIFSVKQKSHFLVSHLYGNAYALILSQRFLLSISVSILITLYFLHASCV